MRLVTIMAVAALTLTVNFAVAGLQFGARLEQDSPSTITHIINLPGGTQGYDYDGVSRAEDDIFIIFNQGHDFEATEIVDLHWTDHFHGTNGILVGATIDSVDGNIIKILGSPLFEGPAPATNSTVIVSRQVIVDTDVDPDNLLLITFGATRRAVFDFRDTSDSLFKKPFLTRSGGWFWLADTGWANPLLGGGLLDSVHVSNGETKGAQAFLAMQY